MEIEDALGLVEEIKNCSLPWDDIHWEALCVVINYVKDRVQPQPKQEWSTCDEFTIKILNTVCDEYLKISTYKGTEFRHEIIDSQKWLKSLKERYTWRPSDEQMDALETAISAHSNYELCRLLEQLKKLKE